MNNLAIWEIAPSKSEIETLAQNVANELSEGTMKAEDVAVKVAVMENFTKKTRFRVYANFS